MWSGYVSFGLVTIPVKLYPATEDVRTPLEEVHTCGSKLHHRRMCEREQREVPQEEIRCGWQAPDGQVVVLEADDLKHLPLPTRKTAEVLGFVDADNVEPILYDRPYWVGTDGPAAQRPYALLVEALARHGTIAVCKVALSIRERLAILRPRHGMLVLHTLRWPQELRDPGDLSSSAPVTDRELILAELLMDSLAGVDITDLRDEYAAALEQLIVAKVSGRGLEAAAEPEPAADLMAALEQSIRDARER
jgi:DNA end-binding protein Ku